MERPILDEQIDYYRARAEEYDESLLGPRDLPARDTAAEEINRHFEAAFRLLREMGPVDRVLELACGTGIWTSQLVKTGREVTVVDASPEMLEITRRKLGDAPVRYVQADLFGWEPSSEYDLVFFAFWLSHVPPEALEAFLEKVSHAIKPGGRLAIVDQYAPTEQDRLIAKDQIYATRPVRDGRTFTIVKVFYDLRLLRERLTALGLGVTVRRLGDGLFFLKAARSRQKRGH